MFKKKVEEVEDDLHLFDALLVRSATKVTESLLTKMNSLKIVARAGVGVDNIDVDAATKNGVVVINAPDGNTISTAEHTFAGDGVSSSSYSTSQCFVKVEGMESNCLCWR